MKKTTIAVPLLCALAFPAFADEAISIYGVIDMALVREAGGKDGALTRLTSGVPMGSRLGFGGSEDLGRGVKALFLLENGFIHRLVSINAFLACHHPLAGHVVPILICKACESAQELEDETLAAQLDALARAQGFEPASSYLEVLGTCARCAGRSPE